MPDSEAVTASPGAGRETAESCAHAAITVRWYDDDGWYCFTCCRYLGRNLPPLGAKQLAALDRRDRAAAAKIGLL
jgi:hypothetical protein